MNEHEPSALPPIIAACPSSDELLEQRQPKPVSWWLRKLFACNPFYLVSAALLLFGCYRVSIDAPLFSLETARLLFNFTAVQVYEVLLVVTAIFLARRSIWYDSTLLVGLESLLVFVPFIFISLAALIDSHMAQTMCLAGGAVAVMRFGSLKRFFRRLNLPSVLLGVGFVLLALNITLPLVYRRYGEDIIGAYINSGPAHAMNLRVWMLVLPVAFALVNLLPRSSETGVLLPQHRWLPTGLFSLWIIVTCVHLYSLGYIYQFDFFYEQTAPALWVLAWTVCLQLNRNFPKLNGPVKNLLMLPPVFVALFAGSPLHANLAFLILTALNIAIFCGISFYERNLRFARHLLFASLLMLVAGLPEGWLQFVVPGLTRAGTVAAGVVVYLLFWTVLLRNPKLAILGSIVLGSAVASLFNHHAGAGYWAFQGGLIFMLLHSLRWNDAEHQGANTVRTVAGLVWVLQSFVWVNSDAGKFWMPCIPGVMVLGIYLAAQMLRGKWNHFAVPAAATLVILSGPGSATADSVRTMPAGILAVIGSFLLFGFGTAAALTRHVWHKQESALDVQPSGTANPEG